MAGRGGWIDPRAGKETFGLFYVRWRAEAEAIEKPTRRTLLAYDEIMTLVALTFNRRRLASITRADVVALVDATAKRSAWRAHDALKCVRRVLSAAVEAELIPRNPAVGVSAPMIQQEEPWILSPRGS